MKIRFQADADLDLRIVRGLKRKEPSIEFHTAEEAGLIGRPDSDVLQVTAELDRILVSHDERTMPKEFGTVLSRQSMPGVFIIAQSTS